MPFLLELTLSENIIYWLTDKVYRPPMPPTSSKPLDHIIIVDTFGERAQQLAIAVGGQAEETEILPVDKDKPDQIRQDFSVKVRDLLNRQRRVMVFFDVCAGVRGGIINVLRQAEQETGRGTRRVLISCYHSRVIGQGFKDRGVSRSGIRHVHYTLDDRSWLEKVEGLFKENPPVSFS